MGGPMHAVEVERPAPKASSKSAWLNFSYLQDSSFRQTAWTLTLIFTWYTLSTALSIYNKTLVGKKHGVFGKGNPFPAPLFMTGVQFMFQALLAKLFFYFKLVERTGQPISWKDWSHMVLPNGCITGMDIGFSNKSLVYITMSFYTMCKSTTPIFLLAFAFIWRLEKPSWSLAGVVVVISAGLLLLVKGEAEFHLLGFTLVMSAACLSGLRFTLTQVLLHGNKGESHALPLGGALEVLEILTPVMSVATLLLSLGWEKLWVVLPGSIYFNSPEHCLLSLGIVFFGAIIAFLMVWTEYQVIKETSALTFMVAGTCKEVLTVLAAVVVFGDKFGPINGVGLIVVILGVVLFNCYKLHKMRAESAEAIRTGGPRPSKDGCLGTAEGSLVFDMSPRCSSANRLREGGKLHRSQLSRAGNGIQRRHSGTFEEFGEFEEDSGDEEGAGGDLENAPLLVGSSSPSVASVIIKGSKR